MSPSSDALTQSPNLRNLGSTFRLVGWISFWIKLVLVVVSGVTVLFAFFSRAANTTQARNPISGIGLFFTVCGILLLGVSVYWSFHYTRWGRRFLAKTASSQPSKAGTLRLLKTVLITDLVGILVTVIGGEWLVGAIIGKAISQGVAVFSLNPNQLVEPIDLFVIQACMNVIVGQLAGIVATLILLQRTTQPRPS
ncbi:MAG: DUF3611 family protein [Acaryochloridaceae cyanobacterium SU_2_1]|nr:DUF3611 family protein [Acaryochloridaceae cyanobacterium SU_2_1]